MKKKLFLFIVLNLLFYSTIFAHGDLHERIQKTTVEIKKHSDSAYLYLKRGKLYFQHESYHKSLVDLNASQNLGYSSTEQKLLFAKNYFRLKDFHKSLHFVNLILLDKPKHVQSIKLKAKIYFKQHKFRESAIAYQNVIEFSKQSFPENYIDASIAWEALNNEESDKKAIIILKKGINDLGKIISLYNQLIELSLKRNNYDQAIETQLEILTFSPRKELVYYKLSEFYSCNKDFKMALEALELSKTHYNKLPLRIQKTTIMKELINNIKIKEKSLIDKTSH